MNALVINDDVKGCAVTSGNNKAIFQTLYFSDKTTGSIVNRLEYCHNANDSTELEIIKNKVFSVPSISPKTRAKTISGLYDCSRLPIINTPLKIGGDTYFAIDYNTLVSC